MQTRTGRLQAELGRQLVEHGISLAARHRSGEDCLHHPAHYRTGVSVVEPRDSA